MIWHILLFPDSVLFYHLKYCRKIRMYNCLLDQWIDIFYFCHRCLFLTHVLILNLYHSSRTLLTAYVYLCRMLCIEHNLCFFHMVMDKSIYLIKKNMHCNNIIVSFFFFIHLYNIEEKKTNIILVYKESNNKKNFQLYIYCIAILESNTN